MSEKKIVVPQGMLDAFRNEEFGRLGDSKFESINALEAALRWMNGELEKMLKGDPYKDDTWRRSESMNENAVRTGFNKAIEGVRRMFLAPEPEVPEAINGILFEKRRTDLCADEVNFHILEAYRRGQKAGK